MNIQQTQKENIGKAIGATVSPKITYAVAMSGLAKHFFGTGMSQVIGAGLGYLLGSTTHVDENRKRQVFGEILQSQKSLSEFKGEDGQGQADNKGIMNSAELLNYSYQRYPFQGKWENFIGQPSKNFHAMIYGRPKQGKSILSVQFAQYLSENFGRVLYVASEEGFSVTLQNKIKEFAMDNPNLDFANFRTYEQIREALHVRKYSFVFIDSVNFIKITPEDIEDLKAENKNTAFITIQQATKNGNFRGSQEFAHNCDAVIRVEAGKAFHQGRFQEPSEMDVFDKPEEKKTSSPMVGETKKGSNDTTQMDLFSANDFTDESNF